MKYFLLINTATFLCANVLAGSVHRFPKKIQSEVFKDSDLVEFRVETNNHLTLMNKNKRAFGTKMIAEYQTKEKSMLEDFVVVQYIKGCMFESSLVDGKVEKRIGRVVKSQGKLMPFKYTDWAIDSSDTDPVYGSYEGDRFSNYRWNTAQDFGHKTQHYYREAQPLEPKLYVRDIPGMTNEYKDSANNISLKFKTCILKSGDVPSHSDASGREIFQKAIKCFEWQSSFIYDFDKKEFDSPKVIDSFCKEK